MSDDTRPKFPELWSANRTDWIANLERALEEAIKDRDFYRAEMIKLQTKEN